jgi:hypothetical protein
LGWVNALGFALTLFLGVWLLMAVFSNVLPGSGPIRFAFPTVFAVALVLAQAATVALGATIVFGFMWRGADFHAHRPRLYLFFWTCAGLLFSLVQGITLLRFHWPVLPNAAGWAVRIYWASAFVGLPCFGLMAYVNIELPHAGSPDDEAWDDGLPANGDRDGGR